MADLRDFGAFRYIQLSRTTGKLLTGMRGLYNPRAEQCRFHITGDKD